MEQHVSEIRTNDEQSSLAAKAMVGVVAAMALVVMTTVLAFSTGVTIV